MNEWLFFSHIVIVIAFAFIALRLGPAILLSWVALQASLANFFVLKQILFFGLNITCGDIFAVGSILGLNFLREFYGQKTANQALVASFFGMLFFIAMSQIHLLYTPSTYDSTQRAYLRLLSPSPRLLLASMGVFCLVQQIDLRLFNFLKNKDKPLSFPLRTGISLVISQALDTILFTFLGLWGLVSSLSGIMLVSFLVKIIIIITSSFFIGCAKKWAWLKVGEG